MLNFDSMATFQAKLSYLLGKIAAGQGIGMSFFHR
jgi:hypothetical protein